MSLLLLKADGETVDAIAEKVMASGSRSADCPASRQRKLAGLTPFYTDEERAWIANAACPPAVGQARSLCRAGPRG